MGGGDYVMVIANLVSPGGGGGGGAITPFATPYNYSPVAMFPLPMHSHVPAHQKVMSMQSLQKHIMIYVILIMNCAVVPLCMAGESGCGQGCTGGWEHII